MQNNLGYLVKRHFTVKTILILVFINLAIFIMSLLPPYIFSSTPYMNLKSMPYSSTSCYLNAFSVLPLILIAGYWLKWIHKQKSILDQKSFHSYEYRIYILLFIFCLLIGLSLGYYHLMPSEEALFWSYIPLSMAMMCLLAAVIADRINLKVGLHSCIPLVFLGMLTTFYWRFSQMYGAEDLRWYLLTTYLPPLLFLVITALYPHKKGKRFLVHASLSILIAHCMEWVDPTLYILSKSILTGYFLKHIYISLAFFYIGLYIRQKQLSLQDVKIKIKNEKFLLCPSPFTLKPIVIKPLATIKVYRK